MSQTLAQLESKILDLQSQIQATQAQITDYQTNPAYVDYYIVCSACGENIGKNINCTRSDYCKKVFHTKKVVFFTKTAELAQAHAQLATLQNELKATQSQYEQEKEQYKTRAMILNQAFVSTPPPKQDTSKHKSYKRDRFSKAIFTDDKLKILRAE